MTNTDIELKHFRAKVKEYQAQGLNRDLAEDKAHSYLYGASK